MITNQLSKIIKYTFIFACIILWSCEKETVEDPNKVTQPANTKYLNAEELPEEFQDYFIQKNINNSAKSNRKENDLSNAIFTEYDIVSMTDDKNITNYSISFFYPDTPENIFYNLVINVLPTGENSRYIFKYICNPADFQNFKAHNFDFNYFVGMTEISLAPTSSNETLTSKMNTGDEDCPKIYIPSSSDSGGNSGAAGGGGGDSSSSGGFNTSVPGYNAPGHTGGGGSLGPSTGGSGGHDHSGCYGSNGQYWYRGEDIGKPHSHNEKKATDCPDLVPPPGNVPVLPMPMIKVLGKELALSFDQIVFLRDKPDLMNVINQHLGENNFSEKSKNFARTKINAAIIEKKIDDTELDACTKAVLEKLKTLKQNDIASIFERFGVPVNGTYTLKIVIGTTSKPVAYADTRWVSKNNYLITISEPYLKGEENNQRPPTDLAIATVLIHELIHAHFMALFDDFHNNGNICAYDNYDCLFMEFVADNFEGTTDPQHSQMFENYIDVMANALQEFQTGIPVSSTEKAALFYHDLALSTMAKTPIFEDRYPLGYNSPTYEERKRITYNREAENDNKTIDDAENGKYIPKGKPCN
jgi:hypothetical protein